MVCPALLSDIRAMQTLRKTAVAGFRKNAALYRKTASADAAFDRQLIVTRAAVEDIDAIIDATWKSPVQTGLAEQSKFAIDYAVLEKLQSLSTSADVTPEVKGILQAELQKIRSYATEQSKSATTPEAKGFYSAAFGDGIGNGGGWWKSCTRYARRGASPALLIDPCHLCCPLGI